MTTSTMTGARLQLATEYTRAGLHVYPATPKTLATPCVVLEPADPWFAPGIGGRFAGRMTLDVTCYVAAVDQLAALDRLETLIEAVVKATPKGVAIESVGPPVDADTGSQGSALSSSIRISAHITEG